MRFDTAPRGNDAFWQALADAGLNVDLCLSCMALDDPDKCTAHTGKSLEVIEPCSAQQRSISAAIDQRSVRVTVALRDGGWAR